MLAQSINQGAAVPKHSSRPLRLGAGRACWCAAGGLDAGRRRRQHGAVGRRAQTELAAAAAAARGGAGGAAPHRAGPARTGGMAGEARRRIEGVHAPTWCRWDGPQRPACAGSAALCPGWLHRPGQVEAGRLGQRLRQQRGGSSEAAAAEAAWEPLGGLASLRSLSLTRCRLASIPPALSSLAGHL